MKRAYFIVMFILLASTLWGGPRSECTTIQSGDLVSSGGDVLTTGFDVWGYNYQSMIFNGYYDNFSRPAVPATEGDRLVMKWNAAWLSNMDCDGDGLLDRHFGYPSYQGSGAWLTNHMQGTYESADGASCAYTYFVKIVAAPADAMEVGGVWKTSGGIEIGPAIWGAFAVIQEIYNDDCEGAHGLLYKSPASPGLGYYRP